MSLIFFLPVKIKLPTLSSFTSSFKNIVEYERKFVLAVQWFLKIDLINPLPHNSFKCLFLVPTTKIFVFSICLFLSVSLITGSVGFEPGTTSLNTGHGNLN